MIFIIVVLMMLAGFNIFKFIHIKEELLRAGHVVIGTVLPRDRQDGKPRLREVGGRPCHSTGYSFNLDGTCIYLTMAALFLAQATSTDLSLAQQLGVMASCSITSKGAE